jgi:hypothetical protein
MLGSEGAVVAYVRLTQRDGSTTQAVEETRVWQKVNGQWVQVHVHRSIGTK